MIRHFFSIPPLTDGWWIESDLRPIVLTEPIRPPFAAKDVSMLMYLLIQILILVQEPIPILTIRYVEMAGTKPIAPITILMYITRPAFRHYKINLIFARSAANIIPPASLIALFT